MTLSPSSTKLQLYGKTERPSPWSVPAELHVRVSLQLEVDGPDCDHISSVGEELAAVILTGSSTGHQPEEHCTSTCTSVCLYWKLPVSLRPQIRGTQGKGPRAPGSVPGCLLLSIEPKHRPM